MLRARRFWRVATVWIQTLAVSIACWSLGTIQANESLGRGRPLAVITPGTVIGNAQAQRWNRTVLIARPRIASGATKALPASIQRSVPKFCLSILATVSASPVSTDDLNTQSQITPHYMLQEIGVGYSSDVGGRAVIVSSDSAGKYGLALDFVESRMLAENEKQIAQLRSLVHTTNLAIFDAPAVMLFNQEHRDTLTRHLIWIDPATGRLAMLVWLLSNERETLGIIDSHNPRLVAESAQEDRAIHVDGNEFFLGFPSKRAFALERLPPGRELIWTTALRSHGSQSSYNLQTLTLLTAAINDALNSIKTSGNVP